MVSVGQRCVARADDHKHRPTHVLLILESEGDLFVDWFQVLTMSTLPTHKPNSISSSIHTRASPQLHRPPSLNTRPEPQPQLTQGAVKATKTSLPLLINLW